MTTLGGKVGMLSPGMRELFWRSLSPSAGFLEIRKLANFLFVEIQNSQVSLVH